MCKTLGLQASPYGIGKALGKYLWLHRSAVDELTINNKDIILSVMDDEFCVVRIVKGSDTFQLSHSPAFDDEREPTIHGHKTYLVINGQAELSKTQHYQTKNLLIFHHKHLFVSSLYEGFCQLESVEWSLKWRKTLPRTRAISSRIGRINGWKYILNTYDLNRDKS